MKVLLIEYETEFANSVVYFLDRHGIEVRYVSSINGALDSINEWVPNIVVTDWMLEKEEDLNWLQRLREHAMISQLPIMMISERDTFTEQKKALQAGADDYMVKPFPLLELKRRLYALIHRVQLERLSIEQ